MISDHLIDIPDDLKTRRAWVCWRVETRDGKPTKVPVNPVTGLRAKVNDPSTWVDFATAQAYAEAYSGIGIILNDGLCGVDLDNCRDAQTGATEPWAEEIIASLASYAEVSPSGTGVHVLVWAELPEGRRRNGSIEIYGPGSSRYFTITGNHVPGTPTTVEHRQVQVEAFHLQFLSQPDTSPHHSVDTADNTSSLTDFELLTKARNAKNGLEFDRLWSGEYPEDDSAGDLSLCNHLAFWTGNDVARMDALFRQSGRMRPKWDEKRGAQTYGQMTLAKAIDRARETPSARTSGGGRVTSESGNGSPGRKSKPTAAELAEGILKTDSFAVDEGRRLYVFQAGVYQPKGELHVAQRVKQLLQKRGESQGWSSHIAAEAVEYIRVDAPDLVPRPPLDVLNCANGLLDLNTAELLPHSPELLSAVQLPVAYDPHACCPAWEQFVAQTFPEDAQELPWELAAWLMTADTSMQKAVLLLGEGANGKSVFLTALTEFIGEENRANVSLQKLESDRFAAAQLVGKLANICHDLPSSHLAETSMFKAITGGDPVHAERKYAAPFSFTPYAHLIFSTNHPPQSPDASAAFFRRWLCVPFNRTFEGAAAKPRSELDRELADPRELSGVLNMALAALPRVRMNGVTETDSMKEASGEFRTVTDPLAVWLERETFSDLLAVTPKEQLRRAYNVFCERTGKPPKMDRAFGRALKTLRPDLEDTQRMISGRKVWAWKGIGLIEQHPSRA